MRDRYLLDNEKLIFQEEQISFKQRIGVVLKYIITGTGLALTIWSLFFLGIIKSPEKLYLQILNDELISDVTSISNRFDNISSQLSNVQKRDDNFYRVISERSPIPASVRQAGFGGVNKYEYLKGFDNSNLLIELVRKGDIIINQMYIQSKSYDTLIYFAQNKQDSLLSIPGILPIAPAEYFRISDPFGKRIHPITGKIQNHTGIDLAASIGKPIHAAGSGKIINIRKSKKGYGNRVTISHGYGFKTLYAHMHDIYVKVGDNVTRGQMIGTVGNSGRSTGPHLHYEVIYKNKKTDPKYFYIEDLTDSEFDEMINLLTASK